MNRFHVGVRHVLTLLAVLSVLLGGVALAPSAQAATASRAMWVSWVGLDGALGNATATTNFNDIRTTVTTRNIKRVYVYMNLNASGNLDGNTVANLRYFRNGASWPAGLELWGAGGSHVLSWLDPAQYKAAALTSKLRGAERVAGQPASGGLFTGVMLDIEPLQNGTWTGSTTDGGTTVTDAERQSFLTVSSDSWTEAHYAGGGYPAWTLKVTLALNIQYHNMLCSSGNTFAWELASRVDEVTVMVYQTTPATIEAYASAMLASLDTVGTYAGVQRYLNSRLSVETNSGLPSTISYYGQSLATLHTHMDQVSTYFATSPNNRPKFSSGASPFGYDVHMWNYQYRYFS